MANRFLGAGDETLNHLLAGSETLSEEGAGRRGSTGFGVIPLVERIAASVAAAAAQTLFGSIRDLSARPERDVN